jgi:integrase
LAPATINKGRGILAAIFSTAVKNGRLEKNPFFKMEKLEVPESEEESPYTIEELKVIFDSPVFTQGFRPKRFNGEASFWLPLLGLYTAGRVNELGQLYVEDIKVEDDIHYIIIKPDSATKRTVKDNKKRRVPLHPDLIKMGFLDYFAKIKAEGYIQLFPELKVTRDDGKLADKWGAWWSSFVRKELHIARIPQPFHAFRHTFIEHGKRTMTNYEARSKLEGHAINTEGDKYGNSLYPLGTLNDEIKKLNFKGLDIAHLFKT